MKIKNSIFESTGFNKFRNCDRFETILSFQIRNYLKQFSNIEKSYYEEKKKLVENFKPIVGKINPEFMGELSALLNIETEIDVEPMRIDVKKLPPDNFLSERDIEVLENIFEFVENSEKTKSNKKK